jgi:hypothetical protein
VEYKGNIDNKEEFLEKLTAAYEVRLFYLTNTLLDLSGHNSTETTK